MTATGTGRGGLWPTRLAAARRIAVIGCPGGGKTTLARRLATLTGLPYLGLDDHYYDRAWQLRQPYDAWPTAHDALTERPAWILDGNHASTLEGRLRRADVVIWLDLPTRHCLWGYLRRSTRWVVSGRAPAYATGSDGRVRLPPELPGFLYFIATFRRRVRPAVVEELDRRPPGCTVIRLRSRKDVRALLGAAAQVKDRTSEHCRPEPVGTRSEDHR
ncbi:topology modulation protein [Streptomyces sp. Ru62]|uniref:topology modulation protein n=1 Tax=Streptomyces sp. Ru62 TaxID=2080745 RepID=UPI000CDCFE84|nr:topology modulation protein [Streptomyces sp. Ru62]POX64474.1 topology modulation protein [Streptomyces sp. Ru62]